MHEPYFNWSCHFLPAVSCRFYLLMALALRLPVENEVLSAACTQLGEGDDLQIVSTNKEQACALSPSARKYPSCLKANMFS